MSRIATHTPHRGRNGYTAFKCPVTYAIATHTPHRGRNDTEPKFYFRPFWIATHTPHRGQKTDDISDFFRKISSVLFFAIKKCFRDVYIYCNTKNGRIKMKSNFNAAVFALFLHSSKNDLLFKTACFKKVFVEM